MDRRGFLKTSALAALSTGVAGCNDDSGGRIPPPPPVVGATEFPAMTFLTRDPAGSDYRPAVDVSGEQIVFERTPFPNPEGKLFTTLFIFKGVSSGSPTVAKFLPPPPANPSADYPYSQTRPDWSWANGNIAFNGAPQNVSNEVRVHVVAGNVTALRAVDNTLHRLYPIWTADASSLVVDNTSGEVVKGGPTTALIRPADGGVLASNLNGKDAAGNAVFGGFAAPRPGSAPAQPQIAYAGQPAVANWGSGGATPEYNQDQNYIFVGTPAGSSYTSAPLESGASIATYQPSHQGRAPYWSPDGNYIVFESSRAGGYALFLVNVAKGTPPQQLTDPMYWAQHGKFFPSGKTIVFTALQQPNAAGEGPRGIVTIDIGALL